MDPCEASILAPGTAVWIWIVRQGEGQWYPGTVQSLATPNGVDTVAVRFEYHSLGRNSSRPATFIGISTTQMKHLERRGIRSKGTDRPQYVPPTMVVESGELNVSGHNL
jgi:hypothetical protein